MTLWQTSIEVYPELTDNDFARRGRIELRNDEDGDYIARWDYSRPIPDGLKLGK